MTDKPKTPETFIAHFAPVAAAIAGAPVGPDLEDWLNTEYPADGWWFVTASAMCLTGCEEGWLCGREAGGIKFGRAVPVSDALQGLSIDVVEMNDVVGPHHAHPNGEIDLVMPIDADAKFDGRGAGWKVYSPGSAHKPTVTGGKAIVLYLLPDGAIEFTRA